MIIFQVFGEVSVASAQGLPSHYLAPTRSLPPLAPSEVGPLGFLDYSGEPQSVHVVVIR